MAPEDAHLAFRWAQAKGAADGPQEALLALQTVTAKFPESAPAYNNLAYGQYLAGNQQAGLTSVRKYAELNDGHPNPHDSFAELLQWAGRLDAAATHYEAAAEIDAEFDQAYLGLAEIAQLTDKPDEARRQITTAIEYAPSDQARINYTRALGNAYLLDGDWRAAMEQFGKAAAEAEAAGLNGIATVAYRQMALTDAMGDGSAFESHLAKADEIQGSTNAASHAFAGLAYGLSGNLHKARAEAAQLEETAQGGLVQVSHALNAMLDLESGDAEGAMAQLSEADPTNPIVRAMLAETYSEMGQTVEAQEFKSQVINDRTFNFFNPLYPVAYHRVEDL
jgi:tetratricopeptide (TPR) repeat protein